MFDKVSQAAEKLATNVSRRAFLGRLGQGALATAGVLGGMLAFGGKAKANIFCRHHEYQCGTNGCCPIGTICCPGFLGSTVCCKKGCGTNRNCA